MTDQPQKSALRTQLDKVSDLKAELESAPFFSKQAKAELFFNEMELFLDEVVRKIDGLSGGKHE